MKMIFSFIESRINKAQKKREAHERYLEAEKERQRLLKDPANWCEECHGDGEVRVRGIRTVTGYEMCYHCGGSGLK